VNNWVYFAFGVGVGATAVGFGVAQLILTVWHDEWEAIVDAWHEVKQARERYSNGTEVVTIKRDRGGKESK